MSLNRKHVKKNLIILGTARSGKTTLAKMVRKEIGFNILSIDPFVCGFQNVFPENGISHHHNGEVSKLLTPFVKAYVDSFVDDMPDVNLVIEGWHIQPRDAKQVFNSDKYHIIVLGYPDLKADVALENIRKYEKINEYTYKMPDEKLLDLLQRHINHSNFFQKECEELKLSFYNTSFNRLEVLENIIKDLKVNI